MARVTNDVLQLGGPVEDALAQAQKIAQAALEQGGKAAQAAMAEGQKVAKTLIAEGQKAVEFVQQTMKDPVATLVERVSFETAYSSPAVYTGKELSAELNAPPNPNSKAKRVGRALRPTIRIKTPFLKEQVFAPYGPAVKDEWIANQNRVKLYAVGTVAGLLAIGYIFGRLGAKN